MMLACLFVAAYFLGAVPFGVLITRAKGVDITKVGSGNVGATNVGRAIGKTWAIIVFLLDVFKGCAPVIATRFLVPDSPRWVWYLVGIAAVAGHCASPFLRFKGGKGVASSLGMVFGAAPIVAGSAFLIWGVIFLITRYVSLASIIGVGCAVVIAAIVQDWVYVGFGSLLFLFVLYTHRTNIQRLRNGTEPKFTFGGKPPPKDNDEDDGGLAMASARPVNPSPRSGSTAQDLPPMGGG